MSLLHGQWVFPGIQGRLVQEQRTYLGQGAGTTWGSDYSGCCLGCCSGNVAPGWAMSAASHASGSAARLVTALYTPWLPFQRAPPAPVGEGRLYDVPLCSGSSSPGCFRESRGWDAAQVWWWGWSPPDQPRGRREGLCGWPQACPCTQKSSRVLMEATAASPLEQGWPHLARRTDSVCARVGMALRAQGGKAGPHPALLTSHIPACFPYCRTIFPKPQVQSQLDLILATFLMAKPGFCY